MKLLSYKKSKSSDVMDSINGIRVISTAWVNILSFTNLRSNNNTHENVFVVLWRWYLATHFWCISWCRFATNSSFPRYVNECPLCNKKNHAKMFHFNFSVSKKLSQYGAHVCLYLCWYIFCIEWSFGVNVNAQAPWENVSWANTFYEIDAK